MRVGFILVDKKRPRVLTSALSAAAAEHGFDLVSLDPSCPAQWDSENVDVIVHKVPEDSDLDARLLAYQQRHPATVLLDPPASVRVLQDRARMLAPLHGKQLILTPLQQPQQLLQPLQTQTPHSDEQQTVLISTPVQVTLPSGCSTNQALQLLATSGLSYPALVKPLITAPPDSGAAAAAATAAELLVSGAGPRRRDGHALGALLSAEGLQQLVAGDCDPSLQLPVVVQQFVPHGAALYKLYVMGPHVVLTRRTTLTQQQLYASRNTTAAGTISGDSKAQHQDGLVLLNRVSAVPLVAVGAAAHIQQQHVDGMQQSASSASVPQQQSEQQHTRADTTQLDSRTNTSNTCIGTEAEAPQSHEHLQTSQLQQIPPAAAHRGSNETPVSLASAAVPGVALADASVAGDAAAPPMWAMQQLAAYLRQQLQLNLFNVDIIAPTDISVHHQGHQQPYIAQQLPQHGTQLKKELDPLTQQQTTPLNSNLSPLAQEAADVAAGISAGVRQYLVVDINFFPGYDKVPGAEQLFADFLSSLRHDHRRRVPLTMTHNQIPQAFGKSKIKLLRGEDADERHQRRTRSREEMSFSIEEEDLSSVQMRPSSFNVLYVQTSKVGLLATPQFQMLAQTWQETVELVSQQLLFGFPESSLCTKCPYYDEALYASGSGVLLAPDCLRKVMAGIQQRELPPYSPHKHGHDHQQQQQHGAVLQQQPQVAVQHSSNGDTAIQEAYGPGNLASLGAVACKRQHMHRRNELIPKSNLLVPDIPSGTLVLTLNLMAYWVLTKQSKRGFGV